MENIELKYKPIVDKKIESRVKRSRPAEIIASRVEVPIEKVHEVQDAYWEEYVETL